MQQTVICPKCNSQNDATNQYCLSCGNAMQNNCPNCGSPVDLSARFCSACGVGLGWATRVREIQYLVTQTENNVNQMISRNNEELQAKIGKLEYDINTHETILNDSASNIYKILKEEHKMALSRSMNKIGMALTAVGLAIIGLSYVMTEIQFMPLIGIAVVAAGFIAQLISGFTS